MYALIEISNQMLEDSAFGHAGASLRKAGLAVAINEMLKRRSVAECLRLGSRCSLQCGPTPRSTGRAGMGLVSRERRWRRAG